MLTHCFLINFSFAFFIMFLISVSPFLLVFFPFSVTFLVLQFPSLVTQIEDVSSDPWLLYVIMFANDLVGC